MAYIHLQYNVIKHLMKYGLKKFTNVPFLYDICRYRLDIDIDYH